MTFFKTLTNLGPASLAPSQPSGVSETHFGTQEGQDTACLCSTPWPYDQIEKLGCQMKLPMRTTFSEFLGPSVAFFRR